MALEVDRQVIWRTRRGGSILAAEGVCRCPQAYKLGGV